jgi:aminopeptidase N
MDEGFNTFAGGYIQGGENPHKGSYRSYFRIVERGIEEPLRTHADHFEYNSAYSMAAYSKGCIFLAQLGYVIGDEALMKGMKLYFETWKFKHPNDNDIIRIMEKVSGLELDWYKEYFVNTTYTIDYGIKSVTEKEGKTQILLEKAGRMPMPLDVVITYKDGSKELHYIPLEVMRGEKPAENASLKPILHTDWAWVYPNYTLEIGKASSTIKSIEIDPSERMADINRKNNVYTAE